MSVTVEIPDSVVHALRLPESEVVQRLRTELAIALYSQGALSLGKSAELAQLSRHLFGEVLCQRGIARHYNEDDLAHDVSYGP
jgi:predicted HTH domain antitoxin